MRPLSELSDEVASAITVVLTDLDDTLTHRGRLPAKAYKALEDLFASGLVVGTITGRPAGWCDLIARLWPVTGVVGENGAFYFAYDRAARRMRRSFFAGDAERADCRRKLEAVRTRILAEVPGAGLSADQAYRQADLAIDVCEDVDRLDDDAVARIKAIFEESGAVAKVSSIHVNGWFGRYDKLTTTRRFASEIAGIDIDRRRHEVVYVGDSPNDAPMFAFFPNACGVANVRAYGGRMEAEPAFVSTADGGHGFVEIAERILAARRELP